MALKQRPAKVDPVTAGVMDRKSGKQSFDEMLSAMRQKTAEIEQELVTIKTKMVALVMAAKDQGDELAAAYIKVFRVARDLDDVITAGHKPIKELCEEFKLQKLPEAFDAAEIKTLTLDTGDRVSLSERVLASIKAGMKEAAIKWLKSNKKTKPLVTETVNSGTLSAYAGTLLEQNISLPEDLFNVAVLTQASLTRGKK